MVRVFFAVEPSLDIRERIYETGKVLQSSTSKLSFVQPELMHVTLRFLGEVSEKDLEKISRAAERITSEPYEMRVSNVSSFGRPPRVVKADVFDKGKSLKISQELDELLFTLGVLKEKKEFSPHITIARVKESSPDLLEKISKVKSSEFGVSKIDSVLFKKSTLTPRGPIYETIFSKKLG